MSHEHAATAVGIGTAATGIANILDLVNGWLGIIAVLLGITLTTILIIKHWRELKALEVDE